MQFEKRFLTTKMQRGREGGTYCREVRLVLFKIFGDLLQRTLRAEDGPFVST